MATLMVPVVTGKSVEAPAPVSVQRSVNALGAGSEKESKRKTETPSLTEIFES